MHPANPYSSCVVKASAGSGKTYQLSARFINLVAAHVDPASILTVTFTNKASSEMRERIIRDAALLYADEKLSFEFDQRMQLFYQKAVSDGKNTILPPLAAQKAAKKILSSTQSLLISTIDSLFYEWVNRFPFESFQDVTGTKRKIWSGLITGSEVEELNQRAWTELFKNMQLSHKLFTPFTELSDKRGIWGIEQRIFELFRHYTFLWFKNNIEGKSYALISSPSFAFSCVEDVFNSLLPDFLAIAAETKKEEIIQEALQDKNFSRLYTEKLLTQEHKISGSTIRGQKREKLRSRIERIDQSLGLFYDQHKIKLLNDSGYNLFNIYHAWLGIREKIKDKEGLLEFHDLIVGCFRLFYNPDNFGAKWFLSQSIEHILLDEFQDTSQMQWNIFKTLTEELLSGQNIHENSRLSSTVFVVGDKKQSIYGFREADPAVIDLASDSLARFEEPTYNLETSYRSTAGILDFVNSVFTRLDPEFPLHKAAQNEQGDYIIPNCFSVLLSPFFSYEKDGEKSPMLQEMDFVAKQIAQALEKSHLYPVYDKAKKTFRPLQAKDICILYRKTSHIGFLEKALREKEIPYRKEEKQGFFTRPEVLDFLAFLKFILIPRDEISLLTILKSPIFSLSDVSLFQSLKDMPYKAYANPNKFVNDFSDLVATVPSPSNPPPPECRSRIHALLKKLNERSPDCYNLLTQSMTKAVHYLPHEFVYHYSMIFGIGEFYKRELGDTEGELAHKNMDKLLELSMRAEDEGNLSLEQFLFYLQKLKTEDEIACAETDDEFVSLMTIHKAKGLEFPFVFVIETGENWFRGDRFWSKNSDGITFIGASEHHPSMHHDFKKIVQETEQESFSESIRLLYVALTRASQYLCISGHKTRAFNDKAFYPLIEKAFLSFSASPSSFATTANFILNPAEKIRNELVSSDSVIPVEKVELRKELTLIYPHQLVRSVPDGDSIHPQVRAKIGEFIHLGIAAKISNQYFDFEKKWRVVLSRVLPLTDELQQTELFATACQAIDSTVNHPFIKSICEKAVEIFCEKDVVLKTDDQKLMIGSLDFLAILPNEAIVIDFKTSPVEEVALPFLLQKCNERGYSKQVSWYTQAISKIYPEKRVRGFIFFTKLLQEAEVVTLPFGNIKNGGNTADKSLSKKDGVI